MTPGSRGRRRSSCRRHGARPYPALDRVFPPPLRSDLYPPDRVCRTRGNSAGSSSSPRFKRAPLYTAPSRARSTDSTQAHYRTPRFPSTEMFAHEGAKHLRLERLLEGDVGDGLEKVPRHRGEGAAGDEDHLLQDCRAALLEELVEIDSADLRHQHVGEDEVEDGLGDQLQCLAAALRHGDVMLGVQGAPDCRANDWLIVHDENSSAAIELLGHQL